MQNGLQQPSPGFSAGGQCRELVSTQFPSGWSPVLCDMRNGTGSPELRSLFVTCPSKTLLLPFSIAITIFTTMIAVVVIPIVIFGGAIIINSVRGHAAERRQLLRAVSHGKCAAGHDVSVFRREGRKAGARCAQAVPRLLAGFLPVYYLCFWDTFFPCQPEACCGDALILFSPWRKGGRVTLKLNRCFRRRIGVNAPARRRARGGSAEPVEPEAVPGASRRSPRLPRWDVSHILVPLQRGARAAAPSSSVGSTRAGLGNRGDTARTARPQYGCLPTWKSSGAKWWTSSRK